MHTTQGADVTLTPVEKSVIKVINEAQTKVREHLMQGLPLANILEALIKTIQSVDFDMKGVVLLLNKEAQTLHPICSINLSKEYVSKAEGMKIGPMEGACGSAAYLKERIVVEDITIDKRWENYQLALDYGLRACWSQPIFSSNKEEVLGTFAMYYSIVRKPSEADIELLELAANLAGTAIEWKNVLNERKGLESSLLEANKELTELNIELDKRVKARAAELEYQNRINKTITDNATAALFMMNEKGYCTFMNPAAEAMIGFTIDEVREKPLHDLIHHTHPDGTHYPMADCPIDRALPQDNSVRAHEDIFIRKDGTFFPVLCAASPIKENGVPVGTVIEVRDITEEKKAQQEIVESAERFKMLLEALPQLSWTATADGNLDYINERWIREYSEKNPEEFGLGESWLASVHPDDLEQTMEAWGHAVTTGINYETQFRIRMIDGSYRWHLVRALPLRDKQGEVKKWFGTSTDIHEQRMALEDLAQAQEQLKITNSELSIKNQELTKTNADLDNFIYTASHDLRAPIINLEGLLQALEEEIGEPNKKVEPILEMMDKAVIRFKKTIEDLTDISKTQRNVDEKSEEILLSELAEEVKESVSELIKKEEATVMVDFSEIDRFRFSYKNLRSIVYNLVSNAIKYRSPERPPVVRINTAVIEGMMRLQVADNGLGVNMSYAEQLFGMFKRLHDHVEGSGVGLYIVKRIVENANGKIEVESEEGKGTAINIFLPIE